MLGSGDKHKFLQSQESHFDRAIVSNENLEIVG